MKGLILKDVYTLKSGLKTYTLLFFIFLGIHFLTPSSNTSIFQFAMTIMIGQMITSTILRDQETLWNRMLVTMPIKKSQIISSKYVSYFIATFFMASLTTIIALIIITFKGGDVFLTLFQGCLALSMALLSASLIIPFYMFLPQEKSVLIGYVSYLIAAIIIILPGMLFSTKLSALNPLVYGIIIVMLAVFIFMISNIFSRHKLKTFDLD